MGDTTFAGYISITGILYFISLIYTLLFFHIIKIQSFIFVLHDSATFQIQMQTQYTVSMHE
jgi:hypothetical protein